jgi:hypothetical protein
VRRPRVIRFDIKAAYSFRLTNLKNHSKQRDYNLLDRKYASILPNAISFWQRSTKVLLPKSINFMEGLFPIFSIKELIKN